MSTEVLQVSLREKVGSGNANRLRKTGKVPGVLYGPTVEAMSVEVDQLQYNNFIRHRGNVAPVFDIELDHGGKKETRRVALRNVQYHPVKDSVRHIDFYQFDPNRLITLAVPVKLMGTPIGVVNGGVLQFVSRKIRIKAAPSQIPDTLEIDVTKLKVGETLKVATVRDLFPFRLLEEDGKVIAHIIALRKARTAGENAENAGQAGDGAGTSAGGES